MKQFCHSSGPSLIAAFGNVAYAVILPCLDHTCSNFFLRKDINKTLEFLSHDSAVCESSSNTSKDDTKKTDTAESNYCNDDCEKDGIGRNKSITVNEQKEVNMIQAVCSYWIPEKKMLLYAISRYDKSLSIYSVSRDKLIEQNTSMLISEGDIIKIKPIFCFKTNKRCCCLTFANVHSSSRKPDASSYIIVAGDLAGDATAFHLGSNGNIENKATNEQLSRVLVGHTASVLTSVKIVEEYGKCSKILTCDRDEKVRISSFPQTYQVEGYLLHDSYVSDVQIVGMETKEKIKSCITCCGDGTIRLWNYDNCQEIIRVNVPIRDDNNNDNNDDNYKPVRVAVNSLGNIAAVMYDAWKSIQLFSVTISDEIASLNHIQDVKLSSIPLGIVFCSDDSLAILTREPEVIRFMKGTKGFARVSDCKVSSSFNCVGRQFNLPMSLMEVDENTGKLKLHKKINDESLTKNEPWLKKERVEIYKASVNRRKKRKIERERQPDN
mmetsp:Transcript_17031/g.20795  ORF Transcript_17031/g.20795 Transcript_17031/m.20795 type:complete len:494 (-) Transcript_17031:2133-3614(-)